MVEPPSFFVIKFSDGHIAVAHTETLLIPKPAVVLCSLLMNIRRRLQMFLVVTIKSVQHLIVKMVKIRLLLDRGFSLLSKEGRAVFIPYLFDVSLSAWADFRKFYHAYKTWCLQSTLR